LLISDFTMWHTDLRQTRERCTLPRVLLSDAARHREPPAGHNVLYS